MPEAGMHGLLNLQAAIMTTPKRAGERVSSVLSNPIISSMGDRTPLGL